MTEHVVSSRNEVNSQGCRNSLVFPIKHTANSLYLSIVISGITYCDAVINHWPFVC